MPGKRSDGDEMHRVAATLLSIEAVVVLLAMPVVLTMSDLSMATAWIIGSGVAVVCILGAATVRRGRLGYVVGSIAQCATVAMAIAVPIMLVLGGLFAVMWFILLRIGPSVERASAERANALGKAR
jgi:hypothetical protein